MGSPGAGARREDDLPLIPERPPLSLSLALARAGPHAESSSVRSAAGALSDSLLDDASTMALAEWTYFNVEEVWSAFNPIAEAVARGFRVIASLAERSAADDQGGTAPQQVELEAWNAQVHTPPPRPSGAATSSASAAACYCFETTGSEPPGSAHAKAHTSDTLRAVCRG